jgi:hypothetical protein
MTGANPFFIVWAPKAIITDLFKLRALIILLAHLLIIA